MLKVLKPVSKDNKLNQGFKASHTGYDFDDVPNENCSSSLFGVVVQSKNSETRNWIANKASDPYKNDSRRPKLITEDYGNYCKIKGEVDGVVVYQLAAHLQAGSVLPKGAEVKAGQIIGKIGNTGNSTGGHTHIEYRDSADKQIQVEFIDEVESPVVEEPQSKKQLYTDIYLGTRPDTPPSDDEINFRLQENKNPVEVIKSVMEGDENARRYWLAKWEVSESPMNWENIAKDYEDDLDNLKDIFGIPRSATTDVLLERARTDQKELKKLKEEASPKTIYKYQDKDYTEVFHISGFVVITEKR